MAAQRQDTPLAPSPPERSPGPAGQLTSELSDLLAKARGEEGLGRFLVAAAAYADAGGLDRDDPRPVLGRARTLMSAGFPAESRSVLKEGLRQNPDSPEILLELGEEELCDGRPQRAIPLFRRVLSLRPDSRHVRLRLAVALYVSGKKEQAVRMLGA